MLRRLQLVVVLAHVLEGRTGEGDPVDDLVMEEQGLGLDDRDRPAAGDVPRSDEVRQFLRSRIRLAARAACSSTRPPELLDWETR